MHSTRINDRLNQNSNLINFSSNSPKSWNESDENSSRWYEVKKSERFSTLYAKVL